MKLNVGVRFLVMDLKISFISNIEFFFISSIEIVSRLDFTSQSFQIGPLRIATEIKLKDFGT